jgi:hypothetical protein
VKFPALAAGQTVQRPAAASDHSRTPIPSIRKGSIVKRIFRLPVIAGGIVMAAVLASLAPTPSSHVYAQAAVYYYPYGQGPYGGYVQDYVAPYQANGNMFQGAGGMFGDRTLGGNLPSSYGYRYGYGSGPYVHAYGRSSYYQPSYGRVYVPFGYRNY